ncbi:MAG TPA: Smr/MutS family protein [Xanthomonadaceae bacterium]|nr:Smr/MutS family protein [Xanthomonadaceae bacterium]
MPSKPRDDDPADDPGDDAALFRDAIGPVRPIPERPPPPAPPKPRPRAAMAERDEQDARSEFVRAMDQPLLEAGDALAFRRDDVPARTLQRLGRGEFAVQDELDLHLSAAREAETLLRAFMLEARDAGHGCVRVIHGKGLHSTDEFGRGGVPVLKNLVDRVLRQRSDVLAFHSAPPRAGGTGAVLVLLAPPRRR